MEVVNTLGRRKKSIARVYLSAGKGEITVNGKDMKTYFPTIGLQYRLSQAFALTETTGQYDVKVNVQGGGITGQAEAIRLGISRALVEINAENKPALKAEGLMTRDPRMVERKKPGQKKARKKFQFSKR
ncbi:30S ribosomal protein S9 [Acidiluteibacter ferrifornacis]|jgi:small subunit ribosomal protein S9|uniref:Small ribosomal subunit protein uS9 n=1 Tax=Acidiluteibacter ferrifornacis TaxID=2692424 RepID=A0A6N9NGS3_9FLAO|nr:30S ribosomal protein S9 [Acidiluteibacter ferrifornacis]MBR9832082.1 30S ribosomal protein S9 [bacterium]NBG65103.1 30S ribosomal protein S9 [Acidiluteibacter ferrifornacis]